MTLRFGIRLLAASFAKSLAFYLMIAGAVLLGGIPLRAQPVASFWGAQTWFPDNIALPMAIAVDRSGNVYIAYSSRIPPGNPSRHYVLKLTWSGGSYTGTQIVTFALDVSGALNGVAVDDSGNVYVSNNGSARVLKETLQPDGSYVESTVADSGPNYGLSNPGALAVDGGGNVYIIDGSSRVVKETPSGAGYTQSVVAGGFWEAEGVAVDGSGNVYITDADDNGAGNVWMVTPSGSGYIDRVVDRGYNGSTQLLLGPWGVAVDGSGNVYVADNFGAQTLKLTPTSGSGYYTESQVANCNNNGGLGSCQPQAIAADAGGTIYVIYQLNLVFKDILNGVDFGAVAVGSATPSQPLMFSFNSADTLSGSVPYQMLTMGAPGQDFAVASTGSTCTAGGAFAPGDTCTVNVVFSPQAAGARDGAVALVDSGGATIATAYVHGIGQAPQIAYWPGSQSVVGGGSSSPNGVAVDGSGNVYIAESGSNLVVKETPSAGGYSQSPVFRNGSYWPAQVAVDGSGNVYIANTYIFNPNGTQGGGNTSEVLKETWSGSGYIESAVASGFSAPRGVAVDGSGNVYVADSTANTVWKEMLSGGAYAQTLVSNSGLSQPTSLAVDGSGNVYIVDLGNNRVVEETPVGLNYIQSVVATGLNQPRGVAVDGSGNVYIADGGNNRVLRETPTGSGGFTQSVLADNTTAGLSDPVSVAVDGSGNVYIGDFGNSRVVKEDLADAPSLNFGTVAPGSTSAAQSVQVINNGNEALNAVAPGLTVTANYAQVAGSGTPADCTASFSLRAGAGCNLSIEFMPAAGSGGSIAGSARLTDNNLNLSPAVQVIPLSGASAATQTITFASLGSATYGASPMTLNATASSGLTVTFSVVTGPGTVSGNTLTITGAGTVVVKADQAGNATYEPADPVLQSLTVAHASVTVTASSPTVTYGSAVPTITPIYSAFQNGDTSAVLATQPACTTTYTTASGVGSSPSTGCSGAVAANYTFTYVNGAVTVSQASVTVTASSPTVTYGSAIPTIMPSFSSFQNGQNSSVLTTQPACTTAYTATSGAGSSPSTSCSGAAAANYTFAYVNGAVTISQASVTVTAASPTVTYGAAIPTIMPSFSSFQNGQNSSVLTTQPVCTTSYTATSNAGSSPSTSCSGAAATNYSFTYVSGAVTVNQATPVLTWATPAPIVYGTALSAAQLNATFTAPGTFVYTPAAGTVLSVGNQPLSVTFTPTDTTDYTTATASVTITVNQAAPAITWSPSANITYGTPLSTTQLDATASVPGAFAYTPAAGTVLSAGTRTVIVTFTPTDATDYTTATANVTITVNQATPVITWPAPAAITYGAALSATQLDATASVPGTFVYSPAAGAVLSVGNQTLTATFTPTDGTDYTTATAATTLTVSKATPTVTWSAPAAISYGTALSAAQLNATSTVPGTFVYTPAAGTVLSVGNQPLSATFTPTDTTDYTTATASVTITVNQAAPVITWPAPAAITYGMALSATQLDATASVPGTFVYKPALGTVLPAGSQTLSVTFTPTNQTDYTTATATVSINVLKATPMIAWSNPANIPYGTVLSGAQLNASASVPGTLVYTPAAGTMLNPGTGQTLAVVFTPADSADYNTATATVSINVLSGCIYVLAPSSTSVTMSGNDSVTSSCGMYINSSSSSAMVLSGSPSITVTGGGTTNIVGWYLASGKPTISPAPQKLPSPMPDPFASVSEPTPDSNCQDSGGAVSLSGSTAKTLNPGTYCHTISMSGNSSVTLNPGLYILKGGIAMSGNTTITGNQVTLYTYSGSISMSGNGGINITAPSSGSGSTYAGIAIFQSRSDSNPVTLSGGEVQKFTGAVYLPNAALTYSGGSSTNSGSMTALVVKAITLSGSSNI